MNKLEEKGASYTLLRLSPRGGWWKDLLHGWKNAEDYGKAAKEN